MKKKKTHRKENLQIVNPHAAGIDIGSQSHFVAVAPHLTDDNVREFGCFTSDLLCIADWLKSENITAVAMESTGVYWIPLFEILESKGFEVKLVNARHVKNVPGRKKTDRLDCQWIQKLHSFGLLRGSFHPEGKIRGLRCYLRHRENLVKTSGQHIQHMQKSLQQMNILLHNVISDITGVTGMLIISAICEGEEDPKKLARFRDKGCKNSEEVIEESLRGNYQEEHIFSLKQSLEGWRFCQTQMIECDSKIEAHLENFGSKSINTNTPPKSKGDKKRKNQLNFDVNLEVHRITGVDLSKVAGFDGNIIMRIISETG